MSQPQRPYGPPQGPHGPPQGPPQGQYWQGPPQGPPPGPHQGPPPGPHQGPPHGPPAPWNPQPQAPWDGQLPGASLGTHVKRAVDWNVATVVVAPRERAALEAAGVTGRLQSLFAWRRSSLLIALPFLVLGVILSFASAAESGTDGLSALGVLVAYMPSIGLTIVPIGCLVAVLRWTELRSTSRFLLQCWLASIALPLLAALVPIDYLVDTDLSTVDTNTVFGLRVLLAISYALQLLPVVLSVPGGVLKGAARVKSLFPGSVLPGWFLISVAPFYSMFTIVAFVLIDQIVGNGVLLLGVALLAFGPWLFVIYHRVYSRPLSLAESQAELGRASRLGGIFLWGGVALILIFAFTAKVGQRDVLGSSTDNGEAFFSYLDVANTVVQTLARGIVTAVVFAGLFMRMIYAQWRNTNTLREDIRREHDTEMRGLERWVTRTDTMETAQTTVNPVYRP